MDRTQEMQMNSTANMDTGHDNCSLVSHTDNGSADRIRYRYPLHGQYLTDQRFVNAVARHHGRGLSVMATTPDADPK